jgi:hypothetical protein
MRDASSALSHESDRVDSLLRASGARWRASQPAPAAISAALFSDAQRRSDPGWAERLTWLIAGAASALVVAGALFLVAPGLSKPGEAGSSSTPGPSYRGSSLATCPVTRPSTEFRPPNAAEAPAGMAWYGDMVLWTLMDQDGAVWSGLPAKGSGLTTTTNWWSSFYRPHEEPEPQVFIIGDRVGQPGAFGFGPGTNVHGEFGDTVQVTGEVPIEGCWSVNAYFRGDKISFVVWVGPTD